MATITQSYLVLHYQYTLSGCCLIITDGGSLYLANCTSDPSLCAQHNVTGFPTLIAYRGLGWLESSHCMPRSAPRTNSFVRIDYHGVITVSTDTYKWVVDAWLSILCNTTEVFESMSRIWLCRCCVFFRRKLWWNGSGTWLAQPLLIPDMNISMSTKWLVSWVAIAYMYLKIYTTKDSSLNRNCTKCVVWR